MNWAAMKESDGVPPIEPEAFGQAIETFSVYCGVVLLSFAQHGQGLRDTIARNFIARGMNCTKNIFAVWKAGSEQDAWILHRTLLDRLFHLHYLGETDTFSDFDDFSFRAVYDVTGHAEWWSKAKIDEAERRRIIRPC
jgi:hypothetical protein